MKLFPLFARVRSSNIEMWRQVTLRYEARGAGANELQRTNRNWLKGIRRCAKNGGMVFNYFPIV